MGENSVEIDLEARLGLFIEIRSLSRLGHLGKKGIGLGFTHGGQFIVRGRFRNDGRS